MFAYRNSVTDCHYHLMLKYDSSSSFTSQMETSILPETFCKIKKYFFSLCLLRPKHIL